MDLIQAEHVIFHSKICHEIQIQLHRLHLFLRNFKINQYYKQTIKRQ